MALGLFMIAVLAWGTRLSWKNIEQGGGWICRAFPEKTLQYLNRKENWWKKLLLAILLGYITMVFTVTKWIIQFVLWMVDGSLFHV